MTARILVCEFLDDAALGHAPAEASLEYAPELAEDRAALLGAIADVDALVVRNRVQIDAELLDAASSLVAVGRIGVGLENFDLEACARRGVSVFPATGANAASVGEYVIAAMFRLIRGDLVANAEIGGGEWPRQRMIAGEIAGSTLGIVGLGHCGAAAARRARGLEMRVIACDPYLAEDAPAWADVERVDLARVLAEADVLSLHTPLTAETRGLIDREAIERMKPGAILINSARGPVADLVTAADALRAGRLGGAAIDVFDVEPPSPEHRAAIEGAPNLILTPHIAGVTRQSNRRVSIAAIENVVDELRRRGRLSR